MYKFLDIQSRKEAADDYQPKGDYITPSVYETKYGKAIDDRFKGYMPIGDYLFNDANKFKQSKIWPSIQTELSNYTLNNDFNAYKGTVASTYATNADLNSYKGTVDSTYATNKDLNAYKDTVGKTYATNADLNSYKDTVGKTYAPLTSLSNYQPKNDYTLNSDFNAYKETVGKTYATNADLNSYKKLTTDTFGGYKTAIGDIQRDLGSYKDTVASTYAPLTALSGYLTPSQYETKYGNIIEDKLKGNLPVGNYLLDVPEQFENSKVGKYIQTVLSRYVEKEDFGNFGAHVDLQGKKLNSFIEASHSLYASKGLVDAINTQMGLDAQNRQSDLTTINNKIDSLYRGYKNPEVFEDEQIIQLFSPPRSYLRTRNYMFY